MSIPNMNIKAEVNVYEMENGTSMAMLRIYDKNEWFSWQVALTPEMLVELNGLLTGALNSINISPITKN